MLDPAADSGAGDGMPLAAGTNQHIADNIAGGVAGGSAEDFDAGAGQSDRGSASPYAWHPEGPAALP